MWLIDWINKRRTSDIKIFPFELRQITKFNKHITIILCDELSSRCFSDSFGMFVHCLPEPIRILAWAPGWDCQFFNLSIRNIEFRFAYELSQITLESDTDAGDKLLAEIAERLRGWQIRCKKMEYNEDVRTEPVLTARHNDLTAEQYCELAESVGAAAPTREQVTQALEHTLFRVSVWDGERIVAMARMNGDLGLCCHINDVAVRPEYQRRGIGRMLVNELLLYLDRHAVAGTEISVDISAAAADIPFYRAMGFAATDGPNLRLVHHSGRPLGDGPSIVKV